MKLGDGQRYINAIIYIDVIKKYFLSKFLKLLLSCILKIRIALCRSEFVKTTSLVTSTMTS